MFHHVVTFKLKPETDDVTRRSMVDSIRRLPDAIPEIRSLACGCDHGLADGNYDVAVSVSFDTHADYLVYATHPVHVETVTTHVRPWLAQRVAVQFYDS